MLTPLVLSPLTLALAMPLNAQTPAAPVAPATPAAPMAMPSKAMPSTMMGSDAMKQSMMAGMDSMQNMPMSGNVDRDFASMMKMHHQQGVDMAQMQLKNGKSSKMKSMAKKIVAAQNKEIAEFDTWLAKQK